MYAIRSYYAVRHYPLGYQYRGSAAFHRRADRQDRGDEEYRPPFDHPVRFLHRKRAGQHDKGGGCEGRDMYRLDARYDEHDHQHQRADGIRGFFKIALFALNR